MQGLILIGADQQQSSLQVESRRLGIDEEAHAVPRPDSLEVPDALILDLAASLGAEGGGTTAGQGDAQAYTGEDRTSTAQGVSTSALAARRFDGLA